jgi:ferric-dicitrate binding protein FerR (iron transport regulator)
LLQKDIKLVKRKIFWGEAMFIEHKIYQSLFLPVLFQNGNKMEQLIKTYQVPGVKDKNDVFNELLLRLEEGGKNKRRTYAFIPVYRIAISIAASVVLALLLHFFISEKSFENNSQQVATIRLPDNSRVVLSQNSTASYPRYWWKREIKLQGEAYFEVEKGEKFTVKTKAGRVNVLGTRFQVSEIEDGLAVKCFEGKVMLAANELEQVVEAGNALKYQNNKLSGLAPLTTEYPQSAYFERTFSNESLSNVLNELETFFKVQIKTDHSIQKHFSGKLETASAKTAVKIICRSLDLDYTINSKNEIIINTKEKSDES